MFNAVVGMTFYCTCLMWLSACCSTIQLSMYVVWYMSGIVASVSQGCAFHTRYAVPSRDWFATVMPHMLDLWRAIRSTIANK